MKRKVRLTESDLHRVIKESVYQILNERIKSEKGMNDDEVRARRNKRYADDVREKDKQTLQSHRDWGFENNYADELENNSNKCNDERKFEHDWHNVWSKRT